MADDALGRSYGVPARREPVLPNGVLGMLIFVATEIMFFSGLISAFVIGKSNAVGGWPPPGQPRLPVEETAVNTVALLASGVALYVANRAFRSGSSRTRGWLLLSIALGGFFVVFQGAEWVALIREGLTLTSGQLGGFFYLIVGAHALHVVAGFIVLLYTYRRLAHGELDRFTFWPAQIFWYFVVGVWPVLYWQVYL
ncbi:MAG: heme-copper oxidase subunit III [Myxococcales bacterium]|jgi:heme/copper-type cytochrome/quinol oxidase subunit 3